MNILLISQCNKNALTETRRILDQFAERRGDRTWQTPITYEGLNTLRKLLRRTARKNTAVSCHWIRGKDHSELLWIVGDSSRFNTEGSVPTNTTKRNIVRREDENDWHTAEDIKLFAALSALMHDLGKACSAFQKRLLGTNDPGPNIYRHEWISLRLFQAFVGNDSDDVWLKRLANPSKADDKTWKDRLQKDGIDAADGNPFRHLPPLAAAVGWLILTHHRLPAMPERKEISGESLIGLPGNIQADWNQLYEGAEPKAMKPYWTFSKPLPVITTKWRTQAAKYATRLLERQDNEPRGWLANTYVMHLARLSLMLADHHYSSLTASADRVTGDKEYPLYANTIRKTGELCQKLDEHLLGVAKVSREVSYHLTTLTNNLPRLARHKGFRQRSKDPRFRWQDKAFDLAEGIRDLAESQGFFGINMASTGCGKTLANGRILYALSNPAKGARFSIALGLRTLTLQTGQAYRDRLNLNDDDLAVRVGGSASRKLFEHYEAEAEKTGSASNQALMEEDSHVHYEGNFSQHPLLKATSHNDKIKPLLSAPILVCTVDHLIPATEGDRGGRQIAPMLRLLSSDLVLDEIDDFDLSDLPALTRLVHWAGLLGTKVLLSSATLPPALVQGLFNAYRAGREEYQRNRGEPNQVFSTCCAWFDEHGQQHQSCPDSETFLQIHNAFAQKRCQKLAEETARRRTEIYPISVCQGTKETLRASLAEDLLKGALTLHQRHHCTDPHSNKRVSFGLIRMANIEPLVEVAQNLYRLGAPEGVHIHLCVYHSQYPLLLRSAIERRLDQALNRSDPDSVFKLEDIRTRIDAHPESDHLLIVLGSPVTEVGRDHDYDWAIVEPSSMRSLIQLAGRVRRHRFEPCELANIFLLKTNLRALELKGEAAFCRPGFEDNGEWKLTTHEMDQLLEPEERETIDSRPRIVPRVPLHPKSSLVDLEHARLDRLMIEPEFKPLSPREQRALGQEFAAPKLGAYSWHSQPQVNLTALLQKWRPFREDPIESTDLVLLPNEDEDDFDLFEISFDRKQKKDLYAPVNNLLERLEMAPEKGISPWGDPNYLETLEKLSEEMELELKFCALKFGTISLTSNESGWRFHPNLGFTKKN
ncbi:MAG: type I-F CRISPR-associated helicase Cas3f [Saccharospirillum sp.]|nr:type I-F CRISPR-associated helicase Cas3f [Saccharospirillum sp.]